MSDQGEKNVPFGPVMLAIVCGSFLAILSISTINVAIPVLMTDFHAELGTVQWTLTGFMLATGVVAPVCGFLSDRFSTKLVFGTALLGFTIMSAFCAFSWNIESLITFRILQGLFSGLVAPTTMTIVFQVVPREKHAFALSLWSLCAMLAPAIGPTLAGWLTEQFSWRWLFYINLPAGAIATFLAYRLVPFYRLGKVPKFDAPGFIAVILSSTSLLMVFSEGHNWGWSSWRIVSMAALGVIMLALFVWRERKIEHPLLNLSVFRQPRYTFSLVVSCIITISLYSGTFLTPVFLQNIQRVSAMDTGLILLPASLVMAIFMPLTGRLYRIVGPVRLILCGVVLIGIGTFAMGHLHLDTHKGYIIFWMTIRNIGISLSTMPATNAGMEVIPRKLSGHASSANNWIRQGMGSFSIGLFTSLLASRVAAHAAELGKQAAAGGANNPLVQAQAFTLSVNDVYTIATVIVLVAIPMTYWLRRRPQSPQEPRRQTATTQQA